MNIHIVIVTYNASPWLFKSLSSLDASIIPLKVVVVDNGSTDDTIAIIEKQFKHVVLIKNQSNSGFGKANNIGMSYALKDGTDYVFLLNQDAWIRPDTIEKLIRASINNPEYYILSPVHLEGTETKLEQAFSKRYGSELYCEGLLTDLVLNPSNLKEVYETKFVNAALWLLPRKCLEQIGGFNPVFIHYGEDEEFSIRVRHHGYKIGICLKAVGVHDRNQTFNFDLVSPAAKKNWLTGAFLVQLNNLDMTFNKSVIIIYKSLLVNAFVNALKLNYKNLKVYLSIFAYLFKNSRNIYINREKGATSQSLSLYLNDNLHNSSYESNIEKHTS